jgi:3-hydroxyisobutyrate dehydrogenase-like beta-hydroxyacid dehydrogenase
VIETSTLNPSDIRAVAPACAEAGVLLVDAPILSGVGQMRDGVSTLLVGGDDDAIRAAGPVLEALAPRRVLLGGLGTGTAAKVANNAVSHAVMVVLLEATALAEASGVAPEVFAELLADPDAGLMRPLTHRLRERVFGGDYDGGMPMEAARKDSVLALRLAQETGVPLFAIQGAHTPYELAIAAGYERDDYAALAKLWEEWTGRSLRSGDSA